jgi:hypothetical protein
MEGDLRESKLLDPGCGKPTSTRLAARSSFMQSAIRVTWDGGDQRLPHPPGRGRPGQCSTQIQILCAVLFLYRTALEARGRRVGRTIRAKRSRKLPIVLTPEEARTILEQAVFSLTFRPRPLAWQDSG